MKTEKQLNDIINDFNTKFDSNITKDTCLNYISYVRELNLSKSIKTTQGYREFGCNQCEGELYEAKCYYQLPKEYVGNYIRLLGLK